MLSRLTILSTISFVALTACATNQENPYYNYSSRAPVTTVAQAPSVTQSAPVSYEAAPVSYEAAPNVTESYEAVSYESSQPASYTRVNHECLKSEKNHELLGAGIGGTIGAIAGRELIGGTKGTVIGAGLGGTAGYGIGDKLVNCDPEPIVMMQAAPIVSAAYVSPTDTEFATISETGTPGYQVLQAQTVEAYQAPAAQLAPHGQSYSSAAQEVSYNYESNTVTASAATSAIQSERRFLGGATSYGSHTVKDGDTVYSLSRKLCVGISDIQSLNNLNANYGINIGDQIQLPASRC